MSADQILVLVMVLGVAALLIWAEVVNRRRHASGESNSAEQTPGEPDDAPKRGGKDKGL